MSKDDLVDAVRALIQAPALVEIARLKQQCDELLEALEDASDVLKRLGVLSPSREHYDPLIARVKGAGTGAGTELAGDLTRPGTDRG